LWVSRHKSDISNGLGRYLSSDDVQFVSSYYGESLKEAKSKKSKEKHIDPYTMEDVDVYEYKGYEIDDTANGFVLFYCGDDCYFDSLEDAEAFIDSELNESLKEAKSEIPEKAGLKKALDRFNSNGKYARQGSWEIANGGYDLDFEVYYKRVPVIKCIDGKLELEMDEYDGGDTKAVAEFISSVYTDCKTESFKEDYCDMFGCESGFFTRDDLNELMYEINERCPKGMQATAIYMSNDDRTLEVDMEDEEYGSETIYKKIDMRKIRKPSDLLRYANSIIDEFQSKVDGSKE